MKEIKITDENIESFAAALEKEADKVLEYTRWHPGDFKENRVREGSANVLKGIATAVRAAFLS